MNTDPRSVGNGVVPGSVQVTSRGGDPEHKTVSSEFSKRYDDPYAKKEKGSAKAEEETSELRKNKRPRVNRRITSLVTRGGSLAGAGIKKKRAVLISGQIVWSCVWLFCIQLIFWILEIVGYGIAGGDSTILSIIGVNAVGEVMFFVGWLMSALCGVIQILIALTMYSLRGINPVKGAMGYPLLGCVTALHIAPLFGFFPWVLLLIWGVIKQTD